MTERPVSPCQGPDGDEARPASIDHPGAGQSQPSPVLNIFSDEFSLEPLDHLAADQRRSVNSLSSQSSSTSDDTERGRDEHVEHVGSLSPFQSAERRASLLRQQQQQNQQISDKSHFPAEAGHVPRTSSPTASIAQSTASASHRSVSTVSRFSMPPRALSPYTGQTGPSHPYAMYSQGAFVNRTSSISSNSTVRPPERNFVAAAPPQHPYALYSQNIVPEHVPGEPLASTPTLVLPVHPQGHIQPTQSSVADEVGDILGTDGYREQLPPYSRYPDGVPEKSYYAPGNSPQGSGTSSNTTQQPQETPVSSVPEVPTSVLPTENVPSAAAVPPVLMTVAAPILVSTPSDSSTAESGNISQEKFDEKDPRRRNKRICCGLPLWIIGLIAIGLITGTLIGGVLGGIVGSRQTQKNEKPTPDPDHRPTGTPTSTSGTLDAIPLPTATGTPTYSPIPTGDFSISARNLQSLSNSCVLSDSLKLTWNCIDYGHFKGTVSSGANNSRSIKFSQAPITGKFIYGDQIPILGSKTYPLQPVFDATAPSEGPAYFFYTTFDKLVIISDDEFPYSPSTAGGSGQGSSVLNKRLGKRSTRVPSQPGDKPWFCWWNTTYIEAFVYANKGASLDDMISNGDDYTTQTPQSATAGPRQSSPSTPPTNPATSAPTPSATAESDLSPAYARVVKIKELRFSDAGTSPPYCQQMQILDNWNLTTLKNTTTIDEGDSETGPDLADTGITTDMPKGSTLLASRDVDSDQCYCQWIYGN